MFHPTVFETVLDPNKHAFETKANSQTNLCIENVDVTMSTNDMSIRMKGFVGTSCEASKC